MLKETKTEKTSLFVTLFIIGDISIGGSSPLGFPRGFAYAPSHFFVDKILLKKNQLGKMLIEQNVEFELREPGSPGCTYTSTLAIFMTKQNFLQKIFNWIIIYC